MGRVYDPAAQAQAAISGSVESGGRPELAEALGRTVSAARDAVTAPHRPQKQLSR